MSIAPETFYPNLPPITVVFGTEDLGQDVLLLGFRVVFGYKSVEEPVTEGASALRGSPVVCRKAIAARRLAA